MPFPDALPPSEGTLLSHDNVFALSPFDAVSFAVKELRDPGCFPLLEHMSGSVISSDRKFIRKCRHFFLLGGFPHRKNYSSDDAGSVLVVLAHLRKEVLMSLHDDSTSGHLGFFMTHERIRRNCIHRFPDTLFIF